MAADNVIVWDEQKIARHLRRRRKWFWGLRICVALFVLSVVVDHVVAGDYFSDDWARFDSKTVQFVSADDGESIKVRFAGRDALTTVRLLGVATLNETWDQKAQSKLGTLLRDHDVILKLEPTQTRDEQGRLMAYVFLNDRDLVNADIVQSGLALADRRQPLMFHAQFEQAEGAARKKHAGLWATTSRRMLPAWRSQWFEDRLTQAVKGATK